MGYIFALLAVASGATKGYCGKRTSGRISGTADAMLANCVRMCLCVLIGFVLLAAGGQVSRLKVEPRALLIMIASGVTTSAFVVSWIVAVKQSAYMLLDVFLLMGALVPMLLCNWIFSEPITGTQWLGLGILLVAVIVMCTYSAGIKGKLTFRGIGLLLFSGVSCGLADFCQKSYVLLYPQGNASVFNFYTYSISAAVLAMCWILFRRKSGVACRTPKEILLPVFGYIIVMAICLFANSYFKVLASGYLTATQLFPMLQGVGIIVATLMSSVFFHERITVRCVVGLVLAFAGLLVMNIL